MHSANVTSIALLILMLSVLQIHSEDFEERKSRLYGGFNAQPSILTASTVNILTGDNVDSVTPLCQGVLIAPNMTITAASCLYDVETNTFIPKEEIFLHMGSLDNTEVTNPKPIALRDLIIYPKFHYFPNGKRFLDDFALLIPASNFLINGQTISTVKMGKHTGNSTVQIVSWGKDAPPGRMQTVNKLHQINAGISSLAACKQFYATAAQPIELDASALCLNDVNNKNTIAGICEGDAGAGVYLYDNRLKTHKLVAIVSKQIVCPPTWPSVVSRVESATKWIVSKGGPKLV